MAKISEEQLIIKLKTAGVSHSKAQLKALHKSINQTGAGMGKMAGQMAIATVGFYAASKAIGSVISTGKEFQQSMANVKAISGATASEFAMLEKNAKSLGATTVHTASDVAALQTEFAKLGFTATEITKVTEGTLALSTAVGSDLATSAATAGTTLRGFGLDVAETNRVTDVMALSFSSSALDMAKFTDSMKYVAPIAKATGVDLEGTTAILGQLANAGISGSMAGTSLRKILLEAGNAGSALAKRMGGPITSFEDFTEKIAKLKADGLDPLSEGADLVGKRAVTAFSILLEGADDVSELGTALNSAAGAAQDMAEIQLNTLEGSLKLATSAMDGLKITIFEMNEGALKESVELFTQFIDSIDEEELLALGMSIKLMAGSFILYKGAVIAASIAMRTFTIALSSTGIGALVVGFGLLTAAVIDYSDILKVTVTDEEKAAKAKEEQAQAAKDYATALKSINNTFKEMSVSEVEDELGNLDFSLTTQQDTLQQYEAEVEKFQNKISEHLDLNLQSGTIDEEQVAAWREKAAFAQDIVDLTGEEIVKLTDKKFLLDEINEELKTGSSVGEAAVADGPTKIPGIPTDTEMEEGLAKLSEFYMAHHMLGVDKLALEEAQMIQAAEDAAGFEGASQEEIIAIQDVFNKKRADLKKKTDAIELKAAIAQGTALANATAGFIGEFKGGAKISARIQQATAVVNMWAGATAAVAPPPVGAGPIGGLPLAATIVAQGLTNIAQISKSIGEFDSMAEGGLISGPLHSGGGVNINAEGGEFVMRRDAVDSVGLETMNAINEGESTGTTNITFSGNVMSQDFIEDEAIPMIKEAIRRGADIGVS